MMDRPEWMRGLDDYHASYPENGELLVIAKALQAELEARFPLLEFRIVKLEAPGWEISVMKAVSWAGVFKEAMLKVIRDGLLIMTDRDKNYNGVRRHAQIDYGDPRLIDLVCDWLAVRCGSSVGR